MAAQREVIPVGEVIACHTIEDWNEKLKAAKESKKLFVIDFTATWCPPCRFIAPVFVEFSKKFLDAVFFKIDVDELNTVAKEFGIEAMPTFIFMKEDKIVDKLLGASKDEILAKLEKHIQVAGTQVAAA